MHMVCYHNVLHVQMIAHNRVKNLLKQDTTPPQLALSANVKYCLAMPHMFVYTLVRKGTTLLHCNNIMCTMNTGEGIHAYMQ